MRTQESGDTIDCSSVISIEELNKSGFQDTLKTFYGNLIFGSDTEKLLAKKITDSVEGERFKILHIFRP